MILDKIVEHKQVKVAEHKKNFPLGEFKAELKPSERDFKKAISQPGLNLIAEIKKSSPSEGIINKEFDFEKVADAYNKSSYVRAVSVLTDIKFFSGDKTLIKKTKELTKKPVLRKDFIIDEYQVYESRFYEADAILLIARILKKEQIENFIKIAKRYSMDCLVEIHNKEEIEKLPTNLEIIGINNRDLDTLKISLDTTKELNKILKERFPDAIIVSESGIHTRDDIYRLGSKLNAVLIGTSLIRAKDIKRKINSIFRPKIKICGITTLEDAKMASDLGADYIGFIFYEKSPRYIQPEKAKQIIEKIKAINSHIRFVGVFVNESAERIREIKELCNLDYLQLHGDEDNDFIRELGEKHIIKAFRIKDSADIEKINDSIAENILLDTYHKELYGGTGKTFDWSIIYKIKNRKIFLSGGLNPGNIKKAAELNTYALDISSGIEGSPGKKDKEKMKKLFQSLE